MRSDLSILSIRTKGVYASNVERIKVCKTNAGMRYCCDRNNSKLSFESDRKIYKLFQQGNRGSASKVRPRSDPYDYLDNIRRCRDRSRVEQRSQGPKDRPEISSTRIVPGFDRTFRIRKQHVRPLSATLDRKLTAKISEKANVPSQWRRRD